MLALLLGYFLLSPLVAGECPQVAASFGDDLDLSSLWVVVDDGECDMANETSGGADCMELVIGGDVVYQPIIDVEGNTSLTVTTMLTNSSQQMFMILSTFSNNSVRIGSDDMPCATNNTDPIMGSEDVELALFCNDTGIRDVELCLTLSNKPFLVGDGSYRTLSLKLQMNCTAIGDNTDQMCAAGNEISGLFCLTNRQSGILFRSGVGMWHTLVTAVQFQDFCAINKHGIVFIAQVNNSLLEFPIYRELLQVEFEIIHNTTSSYPLVFYSSFISANNSISMPTINNLTTGAIQPGERFVFNVTQPCYLDGAVRVNSNITWSQFQPNGLLRRQSFDLQIYRDCSPNNNTNKTIITENTNNVVVIVVPTVVVLTVSLLLLMGTIGLVSYYHSRRKKYATQQKIVLSEGAFNPYYTLQRMQAPLKNLEHYGIEYDYNELQLEKEIGEGNFGVVYRAKAPGLKRGDWELSADGYVAVKTLKTDADFDVMLNFQKEVDTVVNFEHENVIRLVGICIQEVEKTCMIFEYMDLGALNDLLRTSNPRNPDFFQLSPEDVALKTSQFLPICIQLAKGLEYLANKRFVHRDIASRNCLVNSQFVCKIADFGLSRDVYGADYYKVGSGRACLPVRWMPPESLLYGRFTVKSDVWSYGVLMWEVFTFSQQPYYGASNQEVIDNIRGGILLSCPQLCTKEMYNVMLECWEKMPVKRPAISNILESLENIQQNNVTAVKDVENYVNMQALVMNNDDIDQ